MSWNPDLYLKFKAERTRPAEDLVARIDVDRPRTIIDLGCGPGNSTAVLRARWPNSLITGLDSDATMIEVASGTDRATRWQLGDAGHFVADTPFDVVFSNAMIQWLPDHRETVTRLFQSVSPGGAFAFQIPARLDSKLHEDLLFVASNPRWSDAVAPIAGAITSHESRFYYDALCDAATRINLWTTEYCHVVAGPEAIIDWVRSTRLRPFLAALRSDEERQDFEAALLERLSISYPRERDGQVVFPFRRLFCVAYRPGN